MRSWLDRRAARLPAGVSRSGRQLAYAIGSGIVLAAFLWSYWPTLKDLMKEWNRSDEYSSGLLVPFLAAYVIWLRREDLRSLPVRPALWLGLGGFLLAQAVRAVGLDLYSFAERFSLVLSLAAVVLLVLGWRYLAKLATVLLFLCLMLPWPHRVQGLITLPLQRWSTNSAVFCLELAGYEIRQDGNEITIGQVPRRRGGGLQRPADDHGLLRDQRAGGAPGEAGLVGETDRSGVESADRLSLQYAATGGDGHLLYDHQRGGVGAAVP